MNKVINAFETPADINFVNGLASLLFGIFLFLIALCSFEYFIKNKMKNLGAISIKGNITHYDIFSVRNNIIPYVNGNFYNINLFETRQLFESIPWIKQAVVKRIYPNQIEVKLSEYKLKAIWGAREDMKLVDETGFIFEANAEDDEYDQMPQLIGPEGQGKLMLDMYKDVSLAFSPLRNKLKTIELSARGSWVVILDGGAHIELGRGSAIDIVDRASKFSKSAEQMLVKVNKNIMDIQYVDLRHTEGYALRIQGVSTLDLSTGHSSIKK